MWKKLRARPARPKGAPRRFLRDRSGVAAVELALATPFLVLLAVGVVDFGLAWNQQMALSNAVRAGAQYAIVRKPVQADVDKIIAAVEATAPAGAEVTTKVKFYCECPGNSDPVDCSTNCGGGVERQSFVEIDIQATHEMLLPYPGIGGDISLGNTAIVRLN